MILIFYKKINIYFWSFDFINKIILLDFAHVFTYFCLFLTFCMLNVDYILSYPIEEWLSFWWSSFSDLITRLGTYETKTAQFIYFIRKYNSRHRFMKIWKNKSIFRTACLNKPGKSFYIWNFKKRTNFCYPCFSYKEIFMNQVQSNTC